MNIYFKCLGAFFTVLLILASSSPVVAEEEAQNLEDKVAIVNGTVITKIEFERSLNQIRQKYAKAGRAVPEEQIEKYKPQILENLIKNEVLFQETVKKSITLTEKELNDQVEMIKKKIAQQGELIKVLAELGLTEEMMINQIKREMMIQKLFEKEIIEKISITDEQIQKHYTENSKDYKVPEKIKASHILIKVEASADEAKWTEALEKIKVIQQKIKTGEDFAELAKTNSDCPSKSKGGDLGFFAKGQMVKPFEEAAFSLTPGSMSDVVKTKFGYHVIKVTEKTPESVTPFEDVKDKIKEQLKGGKTQEEIKMYVDKLRENAKVETFLGEEKINP